MTFDPLKYAVVIQVGDRFFASYQNRRINTSWCLAGAKMFQVQDVCESEIARIEDLLKKRGHVPKRHFVSLLP